MMCTIQIDCDACWRLLPLPRQTWWPTTFGSVLPTPSRRLSSCSDTEFRDEMVVEAAEFVYRNMGSGSARRDAYGFLKPIIRKDFLEAHTICYDDARFAEDYLFYLRCLIAGARWIIIPSALCIFTRFRPMALLIGPAGRTCLCVVAARVADAG